MARQPCVHESSCKQLMVVSGFSATFGIVRVLSCLHCACTAGVRNVQRRKLRCLSSLPRWFITRLPVAAGHVWHGSYSTELSLPAHLCFGKIPGSCGSAANARCCNAVHYSLASVLRLIVRDACLLLANHRSPHMAMHQ